MAARIRQADLMARVQMTTEAGAALRVVQDSATGIKRDLEFAISANTGSPEGRARASDFDRTLSVLQRTRSAVDFLGRTDYELQAVLEPKTEFDETTVELGNGLREGLSGIKEKMREVGRTIQGMDSPGSVENRAAVGRILATLDVVLEDVVPQMERGVISARDAYYETVMGGHSVGAL